MSAAGQRLGPSGTVVTDSLSLVSDTFEQLQCSHLQDTLDTYKGTLEEAGHAVGAQGWLNASLQTTRGTERLYSLLQQYVQKPAFLHKLTAARSAAGGPAAPVPVAILDAEQSSAPTCPEHMHPDDDVMQASFWEPVPEPHAHEALEGLVEEEALGSYVLVEKEDVLDAIGTFVAAYLATVPEAQHMRPAELQQALTSTFRDLRKGHVRKFWEWGRCAYRCIAFSYGAFSVYENPWLVRAVVTALWTAGKVMLGMLL